MGKENQRLTFISYSRENKDFALELAKELRASGFSIWLDQLDIPTGARWDDEIEGALERCEIFMVILTSNSITSNNVKDEIGFAIDSNKRILPILLENVNVPFRLRRFQYVNFTNISYNEGIDLAKQLLRRLLDEPTEPRSEATSANIQSPQPRVDRSAEFETDANRLARQRAEAVQKARERERMERGPQVVPPTPAFERKPPQPQPQRRSTPNLLLIIVGTMLVMLLCLGGGAVAWRYIFPPTSTYSPPAPTTERPTDETPSTEKPPVEATTEVPPEPLSTTPPPPPITIPSDPIEFVYFYFENINDQNYDLTWELLSLQYKDKYNKSGKGSYIDFWNQHRPVTIVSTDYTKISDTASIVIANSNLQSEPLNYYLTWDGSKNTWLFDPMPESFDVSCSNAPKTLSVGGNAVVVTNTDPLLLRDAPTDGGVIEKMSPGTRVSVVDGPQCKFYRSQSVFFWWWKVRSPLGNQGWVVEGSDSRDAVFIRPSILPVIDGNVDEAEWKGSPSYGLPHGKLYYQNDEKYFYALIDLTGDTTDDPPLSSSPWGDYFWFAFDVNENKVIDANEDINYSFPAGSYSFGVAYYLGSDGSSTGLKSTNSKFGAGFGPSFDSTNPHRIWEFAFALDEIKAAPGQKIRFGIRTYSPTPPFRDDIPQPFYNDFSNLLEVNLQRP